MWANWRCFMAVAGVAAMIWTGPLKAAEIKVGIGTDIISLDPHYEIFVPDFAVHQAIYERIIGLDEKGNLTAGVAQTWKPLDDRTWELKLRPGMKFQDGSPITADDVIFSIRRIATIENSPDSLTLYTRQISDAAAVDPLTVRLTTKTTYPILPNDLTQILVVSRKIGTAKTSDFATDKVAKAGSGPYEVERFTKGSELVLRRNPNYGGSPAAWDRVTYKIITNSAARVAALRAGDVDVIDNVSSQDVPNLKQDAKLRVVQGVSSRMIQLRLDSERDQSLYVTDRDGRPMSKNPMKDRRVRQAMSLAIDRPTMISQVMDGLAVQADQFVASDVDGASPRIKPLEYDPVKARALLKEAGYPDGFGVTVTGPSDRYLNDTRIVLAVAQMLNRVGIVAKAESVPSSTFFTRLNKFDFSVGLGGWGLSTGDASSPLRALVATPDQATGLGGANNGRYSNPALDKVIAQITSTIDLNARRELLAQAAEMAINDYAVIPLHFQMTTWAMRRDLTLTSRRDENTLIYNIRPAQ